MSVPFLDLRALHAPLADEILSQWRALLLDAAFIGGEAVEKFEQHFAGFCEAHCAVAVNSGTTALRLALIALGVRPGDEVITVPATFFATMEAIEIIGAKTVFCDIDPLTRTMDPNSCAGRITSRTVGIIPVHLYGQPADMGPICAIAERHGLFVLEDACQAHGAEYKGRRCGSLAQAAAFSFYPGKNLGACGEGGCVTTNDEAIASRVRRLRDHGQQQRYLHDEVGDNGRLDALQCAALDIKLTHLPAWIEARRSAAERYSSGISSRSIPIVFPHEPEYARSVYHIYAIEFDKRDLLQKGLTNLGIATGLHYPHPLHLQKPSEKYNYKKGDFPVSEILAKRTLSLPMDPNLSDKQTNEVLDALEVAVGKIIEG